MSKNFGHSFDQGLTKHGSHMGSRLAFLVTVAAVVVCVPVMGPGALLIAVGAVALAWLLRPWKGRL